MDTEINTKLAVLVRAPLNLIAKFPFIPSGNLIHTLDHRTFASDSFQVLQVHRQG